MKKLSVWLLVGSMIAMGIPVHADNSGDVKNAVDKAAATMEEMNEENFEEIQNFDDFVKFLEKMN